MSQIYELGDRIIRTKGGLFTKHHAIYIGWQDGVEWIAENQNGYGVRYLSAQEFWRRGKIIAIERFRGTEEARVAIIPRINSMLGTAYNLLTYNCEHFANEILNYRPTSTQVKVAGGTAVLAVLAYMSYSKQDNNKKRTKTLKNANRHYCICT